MVIARTFEGWEARIRSRGVGRFFSAAFLGFWLCGWAAGEVFVLGVLVTGAWTLLTGQPLHPSMPKVEGVAALPVGGFLLLWLTLWTFGGWAAGQTFLRALWGEDRIIARTDGLRVIRRAGPFHRTLNLPRDQLRRLYRTPGQRSLQRNLMVDTTQGARQLTDLATPQELDQLETELTRELGLRPSTTVELPAGWEEITAPEGGTALVESPAKRRRHSLIVSTITTVLFFATLGLASGGHFIPATILAGLAVLFGWGAVRLLFGRHEWRWSGNGLRLDWRFRGQVRTVFEGVSLELGVSADSDNDDWHELDVFATPPPECGLATKGRRRKTIAKTLRDPTVPRRLGEWLAQRSGLPLNDRTTAAAIGVNVEEMRRKLEASGRLGAFIARLLPPTPPKR